MGNRKPCWVDQPFGSKICQVNFPIRADCLTWVLATMVWWITPKDNIPRTQIICTKGETPGSLPPAIFNKRHLKDMENTYNNLIYSLRREQMNTKDNIGWGVIKSGVALPNINAVLEYLKVPEKNYDMYKYITKKNTKTFNHNTNKMLF